MTYIVENSDVTINMTVYQSDGVTAYNLTGASIQVAVYQNKETVLQLFENADVEVVSAAAGTIKVYLDRANIEDLRDGVALYAEVQLTVTDANFSGSTGVLKATDILLGTIKNSVM